ncbi:dipeptide ABC transporter ATP-binding protein [Salinibacterium sp. GXW1014]|uniref:dipeptide ABC transporter ATP-binding protein n=1 Tax=Salinibacterium sp. GXW1014 TaxID=3377838 RepID=UPI00383ABFD6
MTLLQETLQTREVATPAVAAPLLTVDGLRVRFGRDTTVVHDTSFTITRGKCLAIVGESGSGKSVTARALIGLVGGEATVEARRLELDGVDLSRASQRQWRDIRGNRIGFVLQDALVSLDPLRTVGAEVDEAIRVHAPELTKAQRRERVLHLLERVGIPDPEARSAQLPHELSGGLRQRALIATALAGDPELLIADEPTTALDVTVQAQIMELFESLKAEGRALLVISHDLAVVGRLADTIAVMNQGRIVEQGPAEDVLFRPNDDYTRLLIDSVPEARPERAGTPPGEIVADVAGVTKRYPSGDGSTRTVVDDVSFQLRVGETLGIVGESGSGKTTTSRILLGLVEADAGRVEIDGRSWDELARRERVALRRSIQVIYQDTLGSFDPRYSVERVLEESLGVAGVERSRRAAAVGQLLDSVGLPATVRRRRPLELSGGQRQRVAIARALAPRPRVLVCDEPVSALDVSVQAQVLDLLADLQRETGVAYVFISHDLGVVSHVSDRVLVMKDGRAVEQGPVRQVFDNPTHPYTTQLIAAIPQLRAPATHSSTTHSSTTHSSTTGREQA